MLPSEFEALWNTPSLLRAEIAACNARIYSMQSRLTELTQNAPAQSGIVWTESGMSHPREDGAVMLRGVEKVISEASQGDVIDRHWVANSARHWYFVHAALSEFPGLTDQQKANIELNCAHATQMNGFLGGKGVWEAYVAVPIGTSGASSKWKLSDQLIADVGSTMSDMTKEDGTVTSVNFRPAQAEAAADGWLQHYRLTSGQAVLRLSPGANR